MIFLVLVFVANICTTVALFFVGSAAVGIVEIAPSQTVASITGLVGSALIGANAARAYYLLPLSRVGLALVSVLMGVVSLLLVVAKGPIWFSPFILMGVYWLGCVVLSYFVFDMMRIDLPAYKDALVSTSHENTNEEG